MRLRRQNLPWLIITGAMLGLALLPGTATAGLAAALLGCGALALASSLSLKPGLLTSGRLRAALPAMPRALAGAQVSAAARAATERARRHSGSGLTPGLTLLDIGLISAQLGPDGMTMHKGSSFSGDDDGLRPYLSLQVPEHEAERSAQLRFEISDQRGETRFSHEQEVWLREGKRDLLSDNQLPLGGDAELSRSGGEWELQISVDALLVGMLTFEVTPSLRQRAGELERRAARRRGQADADVPGLEDLMREPRRRE